MRTLKLKYDEPNGVVRVYLNKRYQGVVSITDEVIVYSSMHDVLNVTEHASVGDAVSVLATHLLPGCEC